MKKFTREHTNERNGRQDEESMTNCYMQDKDGRYIPAIPEPFWYRGWRTLFRYRPQCCAVTFPTRAAYDEHYVVTHLEDE